MTTDSVFVSTNIARRPKLPDQVVAQIRELVVSGQLQPGERLPAERELAERFGVSRTVIREAVRTCTAQGLLTVRPGSGIVVSVPSARSVAEALGLILRMASDRDPFESLFEVRRLLEVEIAGLAAERATAADLEDIEAQRLIMEREVDDLLAGAEADVEFHAALAQATHNALYCLLLDSVADVMLQVRYLGLTLPGVRESALRGHRAIVEQVRRRDPAGARQAMAAHLAESDQGLRQAAASLARPTSESAVTPRR